MVVVTLTVSRVTMMRAVLIVYVLVVLCAVRGGKIRMDHLLALGDELLLAQHARRTQALQPSQSLLTRGADGPNAIRTVLRQPNEPLSCGQIGGSVIHGARQDAGDFHCVSRAFDKARGVGMEEQM